MYHEQHDNERHEYAPSRIFDNTCEDNRYAADEDSQKWHETGQESDTGESEEIRKNHTPIETQLSVEKPDDKKPSNSQNSIYDSDLALCLENEAKAFLDFFEDNSEIMIKECERTFLQLCEVSLHFLVFEEPDITDEIGEYHLEENTSDAEEL